MNQPSNGVFDLSGTGGASAISFGPIGTQPGAAFVGTVIDMVEEQKTKYNQDPTAPKVLDTWDNGDPKMQYKVTLQTELRESEHDDGKRALYLDGSRKVRDNGTMSRLCAVLEAVKAATGSTELKRGGTLAIQWASGIGHAGDPRSYVAQYTPPAMNLATPAAAPAAPVQAQPAFAAPVQQAPPVSAWDTPAPAPTFAQSATPATAPVSTATVVADGQILRSTPAQPAAQVAPTATPAASGPTPEQLAALQAAGIDPATVFAQ